jgi:hypothetical protein
MSTLRRFHPQPVVFRRHQAAVWAVIASLFALLLSQPFHAAERHDARGGAAIVAAAGAHSASASAHDADLCSFCRANAQTRLGLRAALRAGSVAPAGPSFALHLPAPAPVKTAPLLRPAQPRAPPALLALIAI